MNISLQVLFLFIIAIPIASVAWTITHEEVVREFRDYCLAEGHTCRPGQDLPEIRNWRWDSEVLSGEKSSPELIGA
jgi:hypothetical protein